MPMVMCCGHSEGFGQRFDESFRRVVERITVIKIVCGMRRTVCGK